MAQGGRFYCSQFKDEAQALAMVAQLAGTSSGNPKVVGSIPG